MCIHLYYWWFFYRINPKKPACYNHQWESVNGSRHIDSGICFLLFTADLAVLWHISHLCLDYRLFCQRKEKKTFCKKIHALAASVKTKTRCRLRGYCCRWNFTAMMDMLKELVRPDDGCPPCLANSHKQPRRAATKTNRFCWLTHVIRFASSPLITLQHPHRRYTSRLHRRVYTLGHKNVPLYFRL